MSLRLSRRTTSFALGLAIHLFASPFCEAGGREEVGVERRTVYREKGVHAAFPSLIYLNGELHLFARRSSSFSHLGLGSELFTMRSPDGGKTWSLPRVFMKNPKYSTQEGSPVALPNGEILITAYRWDQPTDLEPFRGRAIGMEERFLLSGGILANFDPIAQRVTRSWSAQIDVGSAAVDSSGRRMTYLNRGAMAFSGKHELLWAVNRVDSVSPRKHSVSVVRSRDWGKTWSTPFRLTPKSRENCSETSLLAQRSGRVVAFIRCEGLPHIQVAFSHDNGRTLGAMKDSGVTGRPAHAIELRDGRVVLVYGRRIAPLGVRGKVLRADLSDLASSPEFVIESELTSTDIGYPWAAEIGDREVVVGYYAKRSDNETTIDLATLTIPTVAH